MMCGTGYLLDQIAKKRSDISLEGVDSSTEFITYAKNKYTEIIFHKADVLERVTTQKYDVVLVT
jgi:trans-aconitate methyltransferase